MYAKVCARQILFHFDFFSCFLYYPIRLEENKEICFRIVTKYFHRDFCVLFKRRNSKTLANSSIKREILLPLLLEVVVLRETKEQKQI